MNIRREAAAEIVECEARLRAAQLASDVVELDALIADDLIFVGAAGQIATKAMDLESHRTGALHLTHSQLVEQDIRLLSEDVAVAVVRVTLAGRFAGQDFAGDFRYLRVWQRGAHEWHIVAGQMNTLA